MEGMEKQLSAVEFLEYRLKISCGKEFNKGYKEYFNKAKEMEKQQIKFFYDKGHLYSGCEYGFEECYNKTFNNMNITNESIQHEDTILIAVLGKYWERSKLGQQKYGTNLDRTDVDLLGWLNHLQEELMDATLYVEKLKRELK